MNPSRRTDAGRWFGSYGRCWIPGQVETDWRPYCNGSWQDTDAGWYWVSDEPWAWATYHYGRWDLSPQFGWYWMPQTQWAPAWVSWHEGGGYVGWAPLQPSVTISVNGFVGFNESRISPRAFVFVKPGQFLDPIRPSIVVVNNTTIINQTKIITNTKIVNSRVVNGGPATTVIEKASGRKVEIVKVQELRQKQEAPVAARQRMPKATPETKIPQPARAQTVPGEKNAVLTPEIRPVAKPAAIVKPSPSVPEKNLQPAARTEAEPRVQKEIAPQETRPVAKPPEIIRERPAAQVKSEAHEPKPENNKPQNEEKQRSNNPETAPDKSGGPR